MVLEVLLRDQLAAALLSLEQLLEQMSGEEFRTLSRLWWGRGKISPGVGRQQRDARLIQQGLQQMSQLDQQAGKLLEGLVPSGDWFWIAAGIAGVEPWSYSLRDLAFHADATAWWQSSSP